MLISLKDAVVTAEIFKTASAPSLTEITGFSSLLKIEKGQHLFLDKEEVKSIYILIKGRASLYKLNSLGEKKVIFVYGEGNMLNEVMFQDLPASINCEMLEDSIVLVMPVSRLWHVMENDSGLTKAVLDSMALKIRRLYRQLKNTTNDLNGEKRLAAKLYKLSKDYGIKQEDGICIDLNLTITFLAEMLGSKRETVSRQAKKLVDMQLLIIQKNKFIIPDQQKLNEFFKKP
ncbi:helix-turn-helix domain-containing protein [Anaerocolumna sedimenticola]|uniref:Helix-turn-helix domain-containing protein n=1 Tax=Anaerocolumna sedimenticola TaxID=2696063 RepID=A0A6P1TUP9_9FIRM|nr:Crp/Fnr family transcriptional regulator [Anaerocolumna sedimenticola]QHQ63218.1 helix-turn-helix domain-containing protein [Anaerocolumna sedimenticola]